MRRTGVPGQRFKGASPLKSPGPSPATFRKPDTPQHAIQPRENQRVLAPTEGRAVFNRPQNPAEIGHAITRTARGNTKTAPPNAMRPTSGGKRPPTKSEAALIQQAQADNRLRARRMRKGGQ